MRRNVSVAPWLRQLKDAIAVNRKGADPEGVHQMRVALARTCLWLRLGEHRVLRDDARWLRCAAAPLRDLDVRLSFHPPRTEASRLEGQRPAALRQLVAVLESSRARALLDALAVLPPVSTDQVQRSTRRLVARVLALGRRAEGRPHDAASLHALRCAVRRLRYALEAVGQPAADVTALQDSLGEACDCAIALAASRGGVSFKRELEHKRAAAERLTRKRWKALRPRLEKLS